MVKSHLLRLIQLFNLLTLELAPEPDADARIYSILCSKKDVFFFSLLLLELFSTSYLNVLIILIISSFREKLRVKIQQSSCALTVIVSLFITSLILSAENSNDGFPSISFSSTETFCDCLSFVIVAAILSNISI